jgi:disulfide oxidoreductase YuzD
MKWSFTMKKPTKKAFYEHMSLKFKRKYRNPDAYLTLMDVIHEAQDDKKFMDLAELTLMSKADRLIYRNTMACLGIELTPRQVDEYLAIVEYGLEYIV